MGDGRGGARDHDVGVDDLVVALVGLGGNAVLDGVVGTLDAVVGEHVLLGAVRRGGDVGDGQHVTDDGLEAFLLTKAKMPAGCSAQRVGEPPSWPKMSMPQIL